MSIGLAVGVIAASAGFAVALMLLVRARFTPRGGHFVNTDRMAAAFGFVGAGFAILLGFVVLLSFQRYWDAKSQASDEATAVFEQYEVAALFQPQAERNRLWGELLCYGRAVAESEWPAMKHGHESPLVDTWVERMEAEVPSAQIATRGEETAFQQWFQKAGVRDSARRQRLLESRGTLPALLWIMLIIGAVAVVTFALLFADPEEQVLGQVLTAGAVTALVVSSLLAVALLASPFQGGHGSVGPSGMRYTIALIEQEAGLVHDPLAAPCDVRGNPV
jgi:hypothetical protein